MKYGCSHQRTNSLSSMTMWKSLRMKNSSFSSESHSGVEDMVMVAIIDDRYLMNDEGMDHTQWETKRSGGEQDSGPALDPD
jgi:hypothetical protein